MFSREGQHVITYTTLASTHVFMWGYCNTSQAMVITIQWMLQEWKKFHIFKSINGTTKMLFNHIDIIVKYISSIKTKMISPIWSRWGRFSFSWFSIFYKVKVRSKLDPAIQCKRPGILSPFSRPKWTSLEHKPILQWQPCKQWLHQCDGGWWRPDRELQADQDIKNRDSSVKQSL